MRYFVCTWSSDIGTEEGMDFPTLAEAIQEAELFRETEEYAAVYDTKNGMAFVVFGDLNTKVFADWVKVIAI